MSTAQIGVIVLAAGAAARFGASKLTVPIDGVPLVRRAALGALGASAHVVVVTGAHRDAVEACVADLAVTRAFNAGWENGMSSSIACGIAALGECDAAIVALADQVLVGRTEFAALIAAHARAADRIIAAQFDGVLGPPILFPRQYFGELSALRGERGARELLQRYIDRVESLAMRTAAVDIDTPQDLARVRA